MDRMKKVGDIIRRRAKKKALLGTILMGSDMDVKEIKPLVGRPSKMTKEAVDKLEEVFKIGGTVTEACTYAMIDEATFYNWQNDFPDFSRRMQAAREFVNIASKNLIGHSIVKQQSVSSAQWWLDRHEFRQQQGNNGTTNNTINVINMPPEERKSFNDEFKKFLKGFYAPTA